MSAYIHGSRSVSGQGDMSPLRFEVEGRRVLSPYILGVDIFVLMHTICIG